MHAKQPLIRYSGTGLKISHNETVKKRKKPSYDSKIPHSTVTVVMVPAL